MNIILIVDLPLSYYESKHGHMSWSIEPGHDLVLMLYDLAFVVIPLLILIASFCYIFFLFIR